MSCGAKPVGHKKFCRQCGVGLNPEQVVCIKCGVAITGNFGAGVESVMGALSKMGKSGAANQNRSFGPLIPPLLMVLFFFTPQLQVLDPNYAREFFTRYEFQHSFSTSTIWGWNSWFGIITLVLGCFILAGKVAEYSLPNINEIPQQLYLGLYGIAALCLLAGLYFGITGGYGVWVSQPIVGNVPLSEIIKRTKEIADSTLAYTSHAYYTRVIPGTAIIVLIAIAVGFRQSLSRFRDAL